MARDIDLKFYMVIVFGKLEDPMQVFPAGTVHKYRQPLKKKYFFSYEFLMIFQALRHLKESPKTKNNHFK
jgi:hypothetical protein